MWLTDLLKMFSKVTCYCSTISYTIDLTYAFTLSTSLSLPTLPKLFWVSFWEKKPVRGRGRGKGKDRLFV